MEFVRIDSLFAAVFLWHPSLIEFVMIYCERSVRKIVGNTGRRLWADQKKNVSGAQHAETERETGHKNKGCRLVAPVSACEKQRTINGCRLRRNSLVLFFSFSSTASRPRIIIIEIYDTRYHGIELISEWRKIHTYAFAIRWFIVSLDRCEIGVHVIYCVRCHTIRCLRCNARNFTFAPLFDAEFFTSMKLNWWPIEINARKCLMPYWRSHLSYFANNDKNKWKAECREPKIKLKHSRN